MTNNFIKKEFPNISTKKFLSLKNKIKDKCSEYYFMDFLRSTNGNCDDAYRLFVFDERLRCLLLKYVLRFEIQIKNSFVEDVVETTGDRFFWKKKEYFIFKNENEFLNLKAKIEESFKNLESPSLTADSYAATYVMSFGTFVSFYKNINPMYKRKFIDDYTKYLPNHSFEILHKYLLCMRALRNRCAHGTHLVSNSFVNQLAQYSKLKSEPFIKPGMEMMSIFELTLYFLINSLNCKKEFIEELKKLLLKNMNLYSKYGGKQSVNPTIVYKLFRKY